MVPGRSFSVGCSADVGVGEMNNNKKRRHMSALALALLCGPGLVASAAVGIQQESEEPPQTPEPPPPSLNRFTEWAIEHEGLRENYLRIDPIGPYPVDMIPPRARRRSKRGQRNAGRKGWMR